MFMRSPSSEASIIRFDDREAAEAELARVQGSVSDQARRLAVPRCGGYGRPREGVKQRALPEMPIDSSQGAA